MESKKTIQGYLECDGIIVKVSSIEDVHNFVAKFEQSINEMSETELDELTNRDGETTDDDCGVSYLSNPLILRRGQSIESYKVKDGCIAIAQEAFRPRKNYGTLKSVFIPDSVISIGDFAFYWNNALSNVRLSNGLMKLGNNVFGGCLNLSSIKLPILLKIIGKDAFRGCPICEIMIPCSVRRIGAHAFADNAQLKNVAFEGIPKEISSGIFDNCKSLEKIFVPKGSKDYFVKALFPVNHTIIVER